MSCNHNSSMSRPANLHYTKRRRKERTSSAVSTRPASFASIASLTLSSLTTASRSLPTALFVRS